MICHGSELRLKRLCLRIEITRHPFDFNSENLSRHSSEVKKTSFPVTNQKASGNVGSNSDNILKPRSETIVQLNVNDKYSDGTSLFVSADNREEIININVEKYDCNILIANTLNYVDKRVISFPVINLNDDEIVLKENFVKNVKLEIFDKNPTVRTINETRSSLNPTSQLNTFEKHKYIESSILSDEFNEEEKREILNLCKKYSDIILSWRKVNVYRRHNA